MKTPRRVDAYSHFAAADFLHYLEVECGTTDPFQVIYKARPALSDPLRRLELMDTLGVETNILVPLPWLEIEPRVALDPRVAPMTARIANDALAASIHDWPDRLWGVALLPMIEPSAAAAELDRAVKKLGFVGGLIPVGPTAVPMDDDSLSPIFEQATLLDVPLWLHPCRPAGWSDYAGERSGSKYLEWQIFGWLTDTTSAMLRLVMSGVFIRFPALKIVTHHCGALIPLYSARMNSGFQSFRAAGHGLGTVAETPPIEHFRNFFCDTATIGFEPLLLQKAVEFFGYDKVLFGTDSPMDHEEGVFVRNAIDSVEALQAPESAKEAIFHCNADSLTKKVAV